MLYCRAGHATMFYLRVNDNMRTGLGYCDMQKNEEKNSILDVKNTVVTTYIATIFGFKVWSRCGDNCGECPALLNYIYTPAVLALTFNQWMYICCFIILL